MVAPKRTEGFLCLAFENQFLDIYNIEQHCDSEFYILKTLY